MGDAQKTKPDTGRLGPLGQRSLPADDNVRIRWTLFFSTPVSILVVGRTVPAGGGHSRTDAARRSASTYVET